MIKLGDDSSSSKGACESNVSDVFVVASTNNLTRFGWQQAIGLPKMTQKDDRETLFVCGWLVERLLEQSLG